MRQEIISLNPNTAPRPWVNLAINLLIIAILWFLAFWLRDQIIVFTEKLVRASKNYHNFWQIIFLIPCSLPALITTIIALRRWPKRLKKQKSQQSLIIDSKIKTITHQSGKSSYSIPYEKITEARRGKQGSLELVITSTVTLGEQKITMPFVKDLDSVLSILRKEMPTVSSIKQSAPAKQRPLSGQKVKGIPVEHLNYVPV